MALTKTQVENLIYKRKSTNDERVYVETSEADKTTIRNTITNMLSLIVQKHS